MMGKAMGVLLTYYIKGFYINFFLKIDISLD